MLFHDAGFTALSERERFNLTGPTEGLAPIIVQQMVAAMVVLKKQGLSILVSEQNQKAIAPLCDRFYILEKGRIVLEGQMAELGEKSDIVNEYLSGL